MIVPKFAVALLQFTLLLVTSLSVSLQGGFDAVEIAQFVAIAAGAGVTFFVPLVSGKWSGLLKTGFAIVAAIATALIPFITQGFITPDQVMLVILAALNAIASEVGIAIRKSVIDAGTYNPNAAALITSARAIDPEGVRALG